MDSLFDFIINTVCLAFSPNRPEWLLLLGGWSLGKAISSAWKGVTGAVSSAGRAIGNAFGGVGRAISNIANPPRPTVTVVGGTSPEQQRANENAIKALQAQLAEQQAAAARAEEARKRQAAIDADNQAAATSQNASIQRASNRLSALNTAQVASDAAAGQRFALATQGMGNVGGGFDINSARLQALSNVGGAGGGALAGASPYMSPSNVAPAALVAAANRDAGGTNARSNRFNIPASNLTYGGA
jgi:uncharacterized membrane protein YqiK